MLILVRIGYKAVEATKQKKSLRERYQLNTIENPIKCLSKEEGTLKFLPHRFVGNQYFKRYNDADASVYALNNSRWWGNTLLSSITDST